MFDVFKRPWELARYQRLEDARSFALEHGWRANKVQVRQEGREYVIEPYEKDCGCPNIIPPH